MNPAKNLPLALAVVKSPDRRAFVRVARVRVVQIYDSMGAAAVEEIPRGLSFSAPAHFVPFARLSSLARARVEFAAKLRRAIAEEIAAHSRQTEMFSDTLDRESPDLTSAPAEKSAVNSTLAGAGADSFSP
jgi:hypothetical protein